MASHWERIESRLVLAGHVRKMPSTYGFISERVNWPADQRLTAGVKFSETERAWFAWCCIGGEPQPGLGGKLYRSEATARTAVMRIAKRHEKAMRKALGDDLVRFDHALHDGRGGWVLAP